MRENIQSVPFEKYYRCWFCSFFFITGSFLAWWLYLWVAIFPNFRLIILLWSMFLMLVLCMDLTLLHFSFRRWTVLKVRSWNILTSLLAPIAGIHWLYQILAIDRRDTDSVYKFRVRRCDWGSLNEELWHVWWLFNRFVDWFSDWAWRNHCDWRVSDLLHQPSWTF